MEVILDVTIVMVTVLLAGGSTSEQEEENATKSKMKDIDPLLFH